MNKYKHKPRKWCLHIRFKKLFIQEKLYSYISLIVNLGFRTELKVNHPIRERGHIWGVYLCICVSLVDCIYTAYIILVNFLLLFAPQHCLLVDVDQHLLRLRLHVVLNVQVLLQSPVHKLGEQDLAASVLVNFIKLGPHILHRSDPLHVNPLKATFSRICANAHLLDGLLHLVGSELLLVHPLVLTSVKSARKMWLTIQ